MESPFRKSWDLENLDIVRAASGTHLTWTHKGKSEPVDRSCVGSTHDLWEKNKGIHAEPADIQWTQICLRVQKNPRNEQYEVTGPWIVLFPQVTLGTNLKKFQQELESTRTMICP